MRLPDLDGGSRGEATATTAVTVAGTEGTEGARRTGQPTVEAPAVDADDILCAVAETGSEARKLGADTGPPPPQRIAAPTPPQGPEPERRQGPPCAAAAKAARLESTGEEVATPQGCPGRGEEVAEEMGEPGERTRNLASTGCGAGDTAAAVTRELPKVCLSGDLPAEVDLTTAGSALGEDCKRAPCGTNCGASCAGGVCWNCHCGRGGGCCDTGTD